MSFFLQLASNSGGPDLSGESSTNLPSAPQDHLGPATATNQGLIELESVSFDAEQTPNIGSAGGTGPGKVTFSPLVIVKRVDKTSPQLFSLLCSGTALKSVTLYIEEAASTGPSASRTKLKYVFFLVAVKTISVNLTSDSGPTETVSFEYGGMQVFYAATNPDGSLAKPSGSGWNRVTNMQLDSTLP